MNKPHIIPHTKQGGAILGSTHVFWEFEMAQNHYETSTVVLVEPNADNREELKDALLSLGFINIIDTGNLKGVRDAFIDGDVHLLIGETNLPEGDLGELIHQVRHQEIGDSPFVVVVALISELNNANTAIKAGVDDVLLKPFTEEKLRDRILRLTEARKKFTITTDYIGPTRHGKQKAEGLQMPSIDIPNPLHILYSGNAGVKEMKKAANNALAEINRQKVERHAHQVRMLTQRITSRMRNNPNAGDGDTDDNLGCLYWVSRDLNRRVSGTCFGYAAYLSQTLTLMVESILEFPELADKKEAENLDKLSLTILRTCSSGQAIAEIDDQARVDALMNSPAIGFC